MPKLRDASQDDLHARGWVRGTVTATLPSIKVEAEYGAGDLLAWRGAHGRVGGAGGAGPKVFRYLRSLAFRCRWEKYYCAGSSLPDSWVHTGWGDMHAGETALLYMFAWANER